MRGFFFIFRRNGEPLAPDFAVDEQYNNRTDHRDDEAAEVETVYATKAEESTDVTPDHSTDHTQDYGQNETTAIFARHDPLSQNTCNKTKDDPG